MKRLLSYLKNYIIESIFGPLFKLLEASFELLIPLLVASIIDEGIAQKNQSLIVTRVLLMILLGVIGLVCAITAQYFAAKAATGFGAQLRRGIFSHTQELSFADLDQVGTSTLITRITSDVNTVQASVNMFLRLFLRSPFIVVGAMIMAMTIDFTSAMIFLLAIVILSAVVFGLMFVSIPLYKKVQKHLDLILRMTRENLTGTRVIRAFHKEEQELQTFRKANDQLMGVQIFAGKISSLMNPITFVLINLAMMLLIHTGAWKVDQGNLTQGQVVALINYMSQILVELIKLANLIIQLTKAFACADRINQVMELQPSMEFPEMSQNPVASNYAVEFHQVGLRYGRNAEESLSDLNVKIKKGETIGIIGGTGSGKTSLISLIPRFYDATRGQVLVNGLDVKKYTKQDIRKQVAVVMQKAVLFKGTVEENLRWGDQKATREELFTAVTQAQAGDFIEKEGLDAQILQGGKNLSGGQKQRLTIARGLLKKAQILILDDSSSALDYGTDLRLRQELSRIRENLTTIIVSQRTASIMHADRIFVLEDGLIVGEGTHEELLDTCTVYQEIHGTDSRSQAGGVGL